MRRAILITSLLTTALVTLSASAGPDDRGPRWDRYQHYDFRARHRQAHYGHPNGYGLYPGRRCRVIEHHHYYHPDRSRHDHDHHDHDVYAIIGGAILLNEILHH
jgi:hypothetical protein